MFGLALVSRGPTPPLVIRFMLLLILLVAMAATYSGAGYLAVGLGVVAIFLGALLARHPQYRKIWLRNGPLSLAALVLALMPIPHAGARLAAVADTADMSLANRLAAVTAAGEMAVERLRFGRGVSPFDAVFTRFHYMPWLMTRAFANAHSNPALLRTEMGAAGIALVILVPHRPSITGRHPT